MHRLQVATTALLAGTLLVCLVRSQQTSCEPNWFGSRCQYRCRCVGATCDVRGQCLGSSNCQGGWFGPACQYEDLAYGRSSLEAVTDGDDDTCIDDPALRNVIIDFNNHYHISWVRLHLSTSDYLYRFRFRLRTEGDFTKCNNISVSVPDNTTLDIYCKFDVPVRSVLLAGLAVSSLCSLYVSGGRNVALKQTAKQSDVLTGCSIQTGFKFISFGADLAIDGNTNQVFFKGLTCSHTKIVTTGNHYWTVTLSSPALVNRYVIYNRIGDCMFRIVGFTLESVDEHGQLAFNYTDQSTSPLSVYTLSHEDLVVKEVTIIANRNQTGLTLCEVEIYGDSKCDYGYFGLDCEQKCNCYFQEQCFVSTGGCPLGCTTGYQGMDCKTPCVPDMYGKHCLLSCSEFCVSEDEDNRTCDLETGDCLHGCEIGYQPPTCVSVCDPGTYGLSCSLQCSPACSRIDGDMGNYCNLTTGDCLYGCDNGYYGSGCGVSCLPNTYGEDCRSTCSRRCVSSNDSTIPSCHHITGECLYGCVEGYNGTLCDNKVTSLTAEHVYSTSRIQFKVIFLTVATVGSLLLATLFMLYLKKKSESQGIDSESQDSTSSEVSWSNC